MNAIETASWRALGTGVHVLTVDSDLDAACRAVEASLDEVDRTYSRFRSDSELSRVNAAAGQPVRVSALLGRAIETALAAARASDGLVDPTVGRAMRLLGYDRDLGDVMARTEPIGLRIEPVPGWENVHHDRQQGTVRLARGAELDLGSTGKALAADLAAEAGRVAGDRAKWVRAGGAGDRAGGVLVSLGGDIAMAGTLPDGGWPVLVAEDSATPIDAAGEVVALHGGGLATSSVNVRRWTRGGIELHHLLDPRTGLPAQGTWRTVSVCAATCVDANTASTASIIRGAGAPGWLAGLGLAARLVAHDGTVHRVGSWPGVREPVQ